MFLLPIFKSGIPCISVLVDFLGNNVYLVFLMFNDNLLALNHWLIHSNSEFTVETKDCLCSDENKKDLYHLQT